MTNMIAKPCLDCGEPSPGSRCPDCRPPDTKPDATTRGYDANWKRLSKRARRLQPFCTRCGATENLQCDHTPEAWQRKADGKPIRLQDIDILCGPCNRGAGAARGRAVTRRDAPTDGHGHPGARRRGQ